MEAQDVVGRSSITYPRAGAEFPDALPSYISLLTDTLIVRPSRGCRGGWGSFHRKVVDTRYGRKNTALGRNSRVTRHAQL